MRAAIYIRLSQESETTTSPERQRALCSAYATARGWTLTGTFEDIDVSATKTGIARPGLAPLRAEVTAGHVDVVVVWRLDRLARSVLDTLTLLREWSDHECAVASATEAIDLTTPVGKAMVALIAIFAEMEADAIKQRSRSSIDALRRAGRYSGGAVGYGYVPAPNPDGPGRMLVVDPTEADVLAEAASRVLAGESMHRICRDFTHRRVPAPRSEARKAARSGRDPSTADLGVWRTPTLKALLASEHLLGRVQHRGEPLRGPDGLVERVWEPALPSATWSALQAFAEGRPAGEDPRKRRGRAARLLSGIIECSSCAHSLYVTTSSGRVVYRCPASWNGSACTGQASTDAQRIDEYVSTLALDVLGSRAVFETVVLEEPTDRRDEAAAVDAAIRETTSALEADDADLPVLLDRLAALKRTRADARSNTPLQVRTLRDTGTTWGQRWAMADVDGRRQLLSEHIDRVILRPAIARNAPLGDSRVGIDWSPDDGTTASF